MVSLKSLALKAFSKAGRKAVDAASDTVSKNPEANSLAETVVKRMTNVFHLGDKILHFHLVLFGVMLGFSLMTMIIAFGKLAIVLEVGIFIVNRDLVFNFGYASFFASIVYGFIGHYYSEHHKRRIKKMKLALDEEFKSKGERLERKFKEREIFLEQQFKIEEDKLDQIRQQNLKAQDNSSVWESIKSSNPVRKLRKEN